MWTRRGAKYRVIKKSLCTWWSQYRKLQVMFKVSAASLKTFIDTRLTLTPSVIHNSNYAIMVSDWNCLKYFCVFFYCNHRVHTNFWSPVISSAGIQPRSNCPSANNHLPVLTELPSSLNFSVMCAVFNHLEGRTGGNNI
jgi:hypothetical protein